MVAGLSGSSASGSHKLARYGCLNAFGITPMIVRGVPSITIVLPSTSRREFSVLRQKSSLMTATFAALSVPSSFVKLRPCDGGNPRTSKKLQVTSAAGTVCAGEPAFRLTTDAPPVPPATSSKISRPNSRNRATVRSLRFNVAERAPFSSRASYTLTSRSASGKGNGRSSTPSTTEKIAVFAPIPSASVKTATRVNAGDLRSWRKASFRSFMSFSAESVHWIDARSSPCRNHAGAQGHEAKQGDAGGKTRYVERTDFKQQA